MAGLEYGPAKRRSKPSRGTPSSGMGGNPPNGFIFLSSLQCFSDEWHSRESTKWQKFVLPYARNPCERRSGFEEIGIVPAEQAAKRRR
ncbi:hypothetical protein [Mesorhizobium silamurunense]|uniref:hypothetical protein n=1 Tax=Mesorhizobium silamurunense TaxID=499528 RepID=UPI00177F9AAF|nr:hypothetical protein [Mesorhizobium silamurunense]